MIKLEPKNKSAFKTALGLNRPIWQSITAVWSMYLQGDLSGCRICKRWIYRSCGTEKLEGPYGALEFTTEKDGT